MSIEDIKEQVEDALVRCALKEDPTSRIAHEQLTKAGPEAVRVVRDELQRKIDFLNQYV